MKTIQTVLFCSTILAVAALRRIPQDPSRKPIRVRPTLTKEEEIAKKIANNIARKERMGVTNEAQLWRAPKTEMGFQTVVGVPVAYSHWKQGRISEVQTCGFDLKAFYWFANHTYVGSCDKWTKAPGGYWPESWGFPKELPADFHSFFDARREKDYNDADLFMRVSSFSKKILMGTEGRSDVPKDWEAPPTKEHYAAMGDLPGSKAPMKAKYSIVISNKDKHAGEIVAETFLTEAPVSRATKPKPVKPELAKLKETESQAWMDYGNYFGFELKKMLDGVKEHCPDTQIVYVRHRGKFNEKKMEGQFHTQTGVKKERDADYELMKQYDNVVTMEDVITENPDVDFNEKQLRVLAKNNCFMSPRGGYQQMSASVAGGKHIVKQVSGTEKDGFYKRQEKWNATVTVTRDSAAFLDAFREQILAGGCKMCVLQD